MESDAFVKYQQDMLYAGFFLGQLFEKWYVGDPLSCWMSRNGKR